MFKAWPKIPRLENEMYHITEKIDGTNSAIIIQPYNEETDNLQRVYIDQGMTLRCQSRTRLITPEDDNFGFAKWAYENGSTLINHLGVGYHFGEWWGQGINRGYGLDHKRFSLFNPTKHSDICYNIPFLSFVPAEDLISTIQNEIEQLKLGSYAAPGYMRPEGLIVYAEKAKTYWKVIIDK